MSSERTIETIQREYSQGCAKAGQLQYQIFTLAKDLELVNASLRDLNNEAATLSQKKEVPSEVPSN
jgi:hypothetical protein